MKQILLTSVCCLLLAMTGTEAQAQRSAREGSAGSLRKESGASQSGSPQPAAQGAMLRVEHPVWDFGDVARKGGDVSHEFLFRNEGDRPLVILRVLTSCSCVKASFPKRPVAPGDSGTIRITYEPHKSEPGTFNKVLRILSNSAGGEVLLTVQGHSLDEMQRGKLKTGKLKIKYRNH